jgi:hypothetical protein
MFFFFFGGKRYCIFLVLRIDCKEASALVWHAKAGPGAE